MSVKPVCCGKYHISIPEAICIMCAVMATAQCICIRDTTVTFTGVQLKADAKKSVAVIGE